MLTLMQRAGEQMNVPPDKVQKYLDDGWTIIQSTAEPKIVQVNESQPAAESEAPATTEDKPRRKKSAQP